MAHAFRVAMLVRQEFGCADEAALAAALLHDTIEDTTTDFDDLEQEFGREVAELVAALTKNAALPEPQRERLYDQGLALADWRARLIKLADALDNLLDSADRPADARSRAMDRARRAVALAQPDAAAHPETARAIAALRGAGA